MSLKDTPARTAAEERALFWGGKDPWAEAVLVELHVGAEGKVTFLLWGDFQVIRQRRVYWRENASGTLKALEEVLVQEWVRSSKWNRSKDALIHVGLPEGYYQLWVPESGNIAVLRYPLACGDACKQQLDKVIKACEQVRDALNQQNVDFSRLIRLHYYSLTRGQGSQHVRNTSETRDRTEADRNWAFLRRRSDWRPRSRQRDSSGTC